MGTPCRALKGSPGGRGHSLLLERRVISAAGLPVSPAAAEGPPSRCPAEGPRHGSGATCQGRACSHMVQEGVLEDGV